jgi:hypothetical protein
MVWEGVGEMAGAIILTSTSTIPGRDIPAMAVIIRSSIMVVAASRMWAAAASTRVEVFTVEVVEVMAAAVAIAEPLL